MLVNPVAQPLFWPTAQVVGGLLAASLCLIAVAERRLAPMSKPSSGAPRAAISRTLWLRWRTWTIIATVYGLAVLAGPLTTALLVLALTLQCLREYAALAGLPTAYRRSLLGLGTLAAPAALFGRDYLLALPPLLLLLATLAPLLLSRDHQGVRHLADAAFGWAYLAWLPAFAVLTHGAIAGGPAMLLLVGLAVALSDVGAFTAGKCWGRHPLAPRLSPTKTWEGVLGNVAGALVGLLLLAPIWPPFLGWPLAAALALLIAVGAVWGDLLESAVKRAYGVKDAGAWLPGFGGLLDRADSFIVVVPLVYHALLVIAL